MAIILPATEGLGAFRAAEWVSVTASIGVATTMPQPDGTITTPPDLLLAADRALYKAKREGQNRVATALPAAPAA